YYRLKNTDVRAALTRLEEHNRVLTVAVEGWENPGYFHPDHLKRVEAAAQGKIPHSRTALLSPFDPLVWDPGRVLDLFDFDYKIEFYFPAHKRKYGYFSLAILYDNKLIGRLDPKVHRKEGIFEVKSLHLEPGVVVDDAMVAALKRTIRACALWHEAPQISIGEVTDPDLAEHFYN
ncbi:MAG TPA: crosslink repair DNA glycosylase YcaQ family protein, partial [Phototrophicaceae bacterium]|nr:crosslink repair DNA glycosylase YcaQ family protein [Phototrophicaceae bacterium]